MGFPSIRDNMDGPWTHYTEVSQTGKDRSVWYHLDVESQKVRSIKNREWNSGNQGVREILIKVMMFKGTNL